MAAALATAAESIASHHQSLATELVTLRNDVVKILGDLTTANYNLSQAMVRIATLEAAATNKPIQSASITTTQRATTSAQANAGLLQQQQPPAVGNQQQPIIVQLLPPTIQPIIVDPWALAERIKKDPTKVPRKLKNQTETFLTILENQGDAEPTVETAQWLNKEAARINGGMMLGKVYGDFQAKCIDADVSGAVRPTEETVRRFTSRGGKKAGQSNRGGRGGGQQRGGGAAK
jgi:uncharacterized membrane protein YgcG